MARAGGKDRGLFERPKGSGNWWIRYHDHHGQERREKVGSKSAARELYAARKAQVTRIKKGLEPASAFRGGSQERALTLGQYLQRLEPELKLHSSWRDMKRFIRVWSRLIGHLPLTAIKRDHAIQRQSGRLGRGKKPATINREIAFLQARLQQAVNEGLLDQNPFLGVSKLKEDNITDRHLTEAEEERLRDAMEPDDFEIVELAIYTGIRQTRLFSLPWKDVCFETGMIRVHKAKGGKFRSVPMTQKVRAILERRYANRRSAFVLPNSRNGNPLDASNFYSRRFLPALKAAGITGITWHRLRHTLGTRLALRGVSLQAIAKILGHSNTTVTERYAHFSDASAQQAIKVLDEPSAPNGLRLVK